MNGIDIQRLEALTHDYAEFDSWKSGLATALGGGMALVMSLHLIHPIRGLAGPWWHLQAALVFLMPVLWLPLKQVLFHQLYRGLGPVKAVQNLAHEQKKWRWIFMIAMVLMTFQTLTLLGFVNGFIGVLLRPDSLQQLPARLPSVWSTWLWVTTLPWLYLLLAPWWIKGVEEARAYLVLVGQGSIWIALSFLQEGANVGRGNKGWVVRIFLTIQVGVIVWAIRTIRRGWREHREYSQLLLSLAPKERKS
jgi:hypothetical protein